MRYKVKWNDPEHGECCTGDTTLKDAEVKAEYLRSLDGVTDVRVVRVERRG